MTESPAGLWRMSARGTPRPVPLPPGIATPARIVCTPDGTRFLLFGAASAQARLVELTPPGRGRAVPWATDIVCYSPATGLPGPEGDGPVLAVARRPGETILRLRLTSSGLEGLPELSARGYDGLGIVATPDRRIALLDRQGTALCRGGRNRYPRTGRVVSFRLDSGDFQTPGAGSSWTPASPGRPRCKVHCIAADETPEVPPFPRQSPVNQPDPPIPHDELSPALPPAVWVPDPGTLAGRLHRRAEGIELPWVRRPPGDAFATYETPATDTAGRYLWVVLELAGNGRGTPRVRALRVEHPAHDLLARLPQVLSRESEAERFLGRFLAPLAGLVGDLDARARLRHALLDPGSTPEESLPWLAGFLGLALDERWPAAVRRQLIAERPLFRFRGTIRGLSRFLAIVTGVAPIVIERYRMRGGATVGEPVARGSRSILGAGMRVGGQVGTSGETPLGPEAIADAFETHAHRFTVMLPALLSQQTLDLAAYVLEEHRPAHTLFDLCTVAAGSRVGRGLHVGLSSAIGHGSGWEPIRIGGSALGRGALLGRPGPGIRTDGARLGLDTRVG